MKTLSRDEMKKVMGGGPIPCNTIADCGPLACFGNMETGYICLNHRCTIATCA